MTRRQVNLRINDVTEQQLDDLREMGYSVTSAVTVAIDRMWHQECQKGEAAMDYRIDREKLEVVTALLNQQVDPRAEEHVVEATICGDWHEGQEHQDWIDSAEPQEIVDWLASFYQE